MTTQEVANRYSELEKQGKWTAIVDELYSDNVVSVEPAHGAEMGMPTLTTGLVAVKAKGAAFNPSCSKIIDFQLIFFFLGYYLVCNPCW